MLVESLVVPCGPCSDEQCGRQSYVGQRTGPCRFLYVPRGVSDCSVCAVFWYSIH